MSPKIHSAFWSDPDVEKLTPEQKLCFLWLMTNSQLNVCGFCQVSSKRFSFETGLDENVLAGTLEALPRALKPFEDISTVYLRKFIRHQLGDGEQLLRNNIFKSVLSIFKGIKFEPLRQAIIEDYPVISQFSESPLKPLEGLVRGKEKEQEQEKEKEKERGSGGKPNGVPERKEPKAWPSLQEVMLYADKIGLPPDEAKKFFDHYEGTGWTDKHGHPVHDWQSKCRSWKTGFMEKRHLDRVKNNPLERKFIPGNSNP